jgi:hypothetical protein
VVHSTIGIGCKDESIVPSLVEEKQGRQANSTSINYCPELHLPPAGIEPASIL